MAEAAIAPAEHSSVPSAATAALRRTMVERQLRPFDVIDAPVLQRFLDVPRELFLSPELAPLAYSDSSFYLKGSQSGAGRFQLPPLILARMLQGAEIGPNDRVLDVAGGAGYSAALLAGLAGEVVALESDPALAAKARENLKSIGIDNIRVECGPLDKGVSGAGPFDIILIYGAVEDGLDTLFSSLTSDGRLVAIAKTDELSGWQVVRFERFEGKAAGSRSLFDFRAPVLPEFAKAPAFAF
jgi:protein-L-isoaspartate(D-aspartate) O-methyltransferase